MEATSAYSPAALPERPYPGLRPFRLKDSPLFFGRSRERVQLLEMLETHPFLAVLGSSGSGKSSLVLSGLLPDIATGKLLLPRPTQFFFADFRPGGNPYAALAESLWKGPLQKSFTEPLFVEEILRRSPLGLSQAVATAWEGTQAGDKEPALVIVVDQFEEFFRFAGLTDSSLGSHEADASPRDFSAVAGNMNEAQAFIDLLLAAGRGSQPRIFIVLTMRSDFYKHCEAFTGLPRMIAAHQYLTPRMDRRQLEDAIRLPLRPFGWDIEDSPVNWMLNDVQAEYDQLPILQHALFRMWGGASKDPGRKILTPQDYKAVGKLDGALNHHGQELINATGLPKEKLARIFRCLGDFDSLSGEAIRRPRTFAQIVAESGLPSEVVREVIDLFRNGRNCFLMPPEGTQLEDATVVDLTHECLLRKWSDLQQWMAEEQQQGKTLVRLKERAADLGWDGNKSSPGSHLARVEIERFRKAFPKEAEIRTGWSERYQADISSLLKLLAKEQRSAAWRRAGWVAAGVAVILIAAGTWANTEAANAKTAIAIAKREKAEWEKAKSEEDARLDKERIQQEGVERQRKAETELQKSFGEQMGAKNARIADLENAGRNLLEQQKIVPDHLDALPGDLKAKLLKLGLVEEKPLITSIQESIYHVRNSAVFGPAATGVNGLVYQIDGRGLPIVAVGAERLWMALPASGGFKRSGVQSEDILRMSVSTLPDSNNWIAATNAGSAILSCVPPFASGYPGGPGESAWISRQLLLAKDGSKAGVVIARWLPGKKLLFCTTDGRIGIGPATGEQAPVLFKTSHAGVINDIELDPSSDRFITSGDDGQAVLWQLVSNQPKEIVSCKRGAPVRGACFSPDGRKILIPSGEKTIRLVDASSAQTSPNLGQWPGFDLPHDNPVLMGSFSPNGRWIATADSGALYIRDTAGTGIGGIPLPRTILRGNRGRITAMAWSPKDDGIVSGDESGTVVLWRFNGGEGLTATPIPMPSHQAAVNTIVWSADGYEFVSGGADGFVRVNPARLYIAGKAKTFGGPTQPGKGDSAWVTPALSELPKFAGLFRANANPSDGVLKRLDPQASYIAARWNYLSTPPDHLLNIRVVVSNPKTGKSEVATPVDWGPGESTGKAMDLSPGLMERLGLGPDDVAEISVPLLQTNVELK